MTPDSNSMRRLTAIQRSRGHVTLAEIKSILPIDSMTPEEIGQTMAQLEEAGIDIEVDKELLRRRPKSGLSDVPRSSHSRLATPNAKGPMSTRTDQGFALGPIDPLGSATLASGRLMVETSRPTRRPRHSGSGRALPPPGPYCSQPVARRQVNISVVGGEARPAPAHDERQSGPEGSQSHA